jgi:anti-sigma factor RsiW
MNCFEVRRHWMLYLDDEGDPMLRRRLREHLVGCPDCASWFALQERLEREISQRLTAGEATPELWGRVLARAGLVPTAHARRGRLLALVGAMAAAAVLLAVLLLRPWVGEGSGPTDLARDAAERHERWLRGELRPELASTSEIEVDRYLQERATFHVHCPPRSDVHFAVQGAGLCRTAGQQPAAYIVGRVDGAPVSILVLDRSSLGAFPHEEANLREGKRHRCREGGYEMVSGVVAGSVVVVIGSAPPEKLERLLDAYGSYHDG